MTVTEDRRIEEYLIDAHELGQAENKILNFTRYKGIKDTVFLGAKELFNNELGED